MRNLPLNCEIGEGVQMEQVLIPPMILQPYIENAIWHGLMHKKGKRLLSLIFQKCEGAIFVVSFKIMELEEKGDGIKEQVDQKIQKHGHGNYRGSHPNW